MAERQVWSMEMLDRIIGKSKPTPKGTRPNPPKRPKKPKAKTGKFSKKVSQEKWLETQKSYLRWRKTPEFQKWRRKQFLKQGGTCYYCDLPLYGGTRENVEHVIPKILGGDNRRSNLVLACANCNKEKYTNLLSFKEREVLKHKNKAKRGTYLETRELYKTETDIALELRDMFRE